MGCDISWYACEPDIAKQRQASLFLNAILDRLNWKVSDKECAETDIYRGFEYAYFINLDAIDFKFIDTHRSLMRALTGNNTHFEKYGAEKIIKAKPRKFTGFTAHLEGRADYSRNINRDWIPYDFSRWQFSMVFNNSPLPDSEEKKGDLLTFEWLTHPKILMSTEILNFLKDQNQKQDFKIGVYRKGGHTRTSGQKDMFLILYLIRELFIPSLHVSDDWAYIKDLDKEIELAGYKKALSSPSEKWEAVRELSRKYLDIEFNARNIKAQITHRWGLLD